MIPLKISFNKLFAGMQEVGRITRTIFVLFFLFYLPLYTESPVYLHDLTVPVQMTL